jgi:hypothetical protein
MHLYRNDVLLSELYVREFTADLFHTVGVFVVRLVYIFTDFTPIACLYNCADRAYSRVPPTFFPCTKTLAISLSSDTNKNRSNVSLSLIRFRSVVSPVGRPSPTSRKKFGERPGVTWSASNSFPGKKLPTVSDILHNAAPPMVAR